MLTLWRWSGIPSPARPAHTPPLRCPESDRHEHLTVVLAGAGLHDALVERWEEHRATVTRATEQSARDYADRWWGRRADAFLVRLADAAIDQTCGKHAAPYGYPQRVAGERDGSWLLACGHTLLRGVDPESPPLRCPRCVFRLHGTERLLCRARARFSGGKGRQMKHDKT